MIQLQKPYALIIFGPTAVGKTDFALEIAKHIPSEIVNGDIGQFYTPLTIGTAKPDWKNEPVTHHLFDIIDEPLYFSVFAYRKLMLDVVTDIYQRGKLPIIVGGSGFYLKSIFFPPAVHEYKEVNESHESNKDISLWDQLYEIDPCRAKQLHPKDTYRIKRALRIWQETGKKPSELLPLYDSPFSFSLLYLSRDREQLYDRINTRTGIMVREGWLQEVAALQGTAWESFLYEKKLIGYDILLDYLNGEKTEARLLEAIALIQQRTRHYAKRQHTFWKSFKKQLDNAKKSLSNAKNTPKHVDDAYLINLTLLDRDLYIKQLIKRLRVHIKQV